MKFGAVITAAGLSSRMGAFKPLLPLGGVPVIGRVIGALRKGGAGDIVVVTGRDAPLLEEALLPYGVGFIHNGDYARTDMFQSAALGFEFMAGRVDGLFFTPADIPLFAAVTVRLLAERLRQGDGHIVVPVCGGKKGHPVVMLSSTARELARHKNSGGLRGAMDAYDGPKGTLEVDDQGILRDLDTPEDYRLLASQCPTEP
ncbi:MAG: nucleotidyltransferase family protein [Treponema sp.]|nr:nucleotidyltransferase family protein [Treponema sp.]